MDTFTQLLPSDGKLAGALLQETIFSIPDLNFRRRSFYFLLTFAPKPTLIQRLF